MRRILENDLSIEMSLTDEELILVTSTKIGMKFLVSSKIISQTDLLDYRLIKMNELSFTNCDIKRAALKDEISCVDFLLSLRNYLEETNPKSFMLIENLKDDNPSEYRLHN